MKCRSDFVTNSSSSSFIIAKHESCTREDIHTALNNMRDDIKKMLESDGKYIYFENNDDVQYLLKKNKVEEAVDLAIKELEDRLYNFVDYKPLVLDHWECDSQEFYDDDGDLLAIFLMHYGHKFKCNTLKIG